MTNKIDFCARLRALASGELTGEIPSFEYSLAADEIERLTNTLTEIVNLSAGWDDEGSTGPKEPFSWETVARVALDYARSELVYNAVLSGKPPQTEL